MPKIPVSGNKVQARGFQTSGLSTRAPDTTSPSIAKGVSGLLNKGFQIYQDELEKNIKTESGDGENKINDLYNENIHGKYNPDGSVVKEGYLSYKGRTAAEKYKETLDDFDSRSKELVDSYGNEEVRKRLQKYADLKRTDYTNRLSSHSFKENERYYFNQTKSTIAKTQEDAKLNYKEFDSNGVPMVNKAALRIRSQIFGVKNKDGSLSQKGFMHYSGMSKEEADEFYKDSMSQFHYGIIERALNNDENDFAKNHYKLAKELKQIDGDSAAKIDGMLEVSTTRGDSLALVNEALSKTNSEVEAKAYIREHKKTQDNVSLLDASIARLSKRWNEEEQLRFERASSEYSSVVKELEKYKSIDHVPKDVQARLDKRKTDALNKYLVHYVSKGVNPETDPMTYDKLEFLATKKTNKFLLTDINEYIHKLSKEDRERFINLQNDIRKNGKKGDLGKMANSSQVITDVADELGLKGKKAGAFKNEVRARAARWQEENGKEISNEELRSIADALGTQVDAEGADFSDPRLFTVSSDKAIIDVEYGDIPEREKRRIREALNQANEPVTNKKIKEYFLRRLKKIRGM